jgi:hypothetical protein
MSLEHNVFLIVSGRARRAAVPVVPQSLSPTPVTADPGRALPSYDVNAAFTSSQPHEGGIHAVWSGAGESSVTEVHFRCAPRLRYAPRGNVRLGGIESGTP